MRIGVLVLLCLVLIGNALYLHRVPGLLGDEGSEGENVYQILDTKKIAVVGERSYIGPLIDYVRIPFILTFGYTVLALRVVMLLATLAVAWLAWQVFDRLFGTGIGIWAAVALMFSPVYLLEQRLGWAITLIPFFALLMLYFWTNKPSTLTPLWVGLVAGVGLANHIMFFSSLVAILFIAAVMSWRRFSKYWLLFLVGFWAGFGMQFTILNLKYDDQPREQKLIVILQKNLAELPAVGPGVLSGSSYVARYVGTPWPAAVEYAVVVILAALGATAISIPSSARRYAWAWAVGIVIQILGIAVMVDHYALRYVTAPALAVWVLAGVGLGVLVSKLSITSQLREFLPIVAAVILAAATVFLVFIPFIRTGGSTAHFPLGSRTETSAHFTDQRPLIDCRRGQGTVFSDKVQIHDMLLYLSRGLADLEVTDLKDRAAWLVDFRVPGTAAGTLCPQLEHWIVNPA